MLLVTVTLWLPRSPGAMLIIVLGGEMLTEAAVAREACRGSINSVTVTNLHTVITS
jgi:hypothetical protein